MNIKQHRWHIAIYAAYLVLACLITWPLLLNLNSAFVGAPESDAYEYARHSWWLGYALRNNLPLFSHPLLAYPNGLPGLWLWAIPLQSFPVWPLSELLTLPVAYNLVALGRLALNGWATAYLARRLLNGTYTPTPLTAHAGAAAVIAGAVFMTFPAAQGQLFASHIGILALWPVPLAIDALLRLRFGDRRLVAYERAAIFITLSALGSLMNLVFVLGPFLAVQLLTDLTARRWAALRRTVIALGVAALLLSVFAVPALVEQVTSESAVRPGGVVRFSADLLAFASPSFLRPAAPEWSARVLGTNLAEGYGYIGLLVGLLAVAGAIRWKDARTLLWVALGAWVLSLGPLLKLYDTPLTFTADGRASFIPLPFAALHALPVLDITRTPARFNLAVGLAVALLVGYGVAWGLNAIRLPRAWQSYGLAVSVSLLIALDFALTWGGFPTVPAALPPEIAALRDDPSVDAVFNIPHDNLLVAKQAMYLQTAHHKPLIGGFVSRETPVSASKRELLQTSLDPALLAEAGVDVVVVWRGYDSELDATVERELGPPFYSDERIAAFRVPEADEMPRRTTAVGNPTHLYSPSDGWARLAATVQGSATALTIQRDGTTIYRAPLGGSTMLELPIPVTTGYQSITISADPPCPDVAPVSGRACGPLTTSDVTLSDGPPLTLDTPILFGENITLRGAAVTRSADAVTIPLYWTFSQPPPPDAVRFIQVIGPDGERIAGDDQPLNAQQALVEEMVLTLPENAPDDLRVYVGWYTFPSLERLPVSALAVGAQDRWALVGNAPAAPSS